MARWLFRAVFAVLLLALAGGAAVLRFGAPMPVPGSAAADVASETTFSPRWIPEPVPETAFGPSPDTAPGALSEAGLDRALRRLTRRLAAAPGDVEARSNLAAVLIARAERSGQATDLLVAYREIERVLATAPEHQEALFNRALVVDRLGLRGSARAAWSEWSSVESDPSAERVRRRIGELDRPVLFESWESEGRSLLLRAARAGDEAEARRLARTYRPFVRQWVEETVLPCWAGAKLEACPDEIAPGAATILGHAVADTARDHTLADTLAKAHGGGERRHLVLRGLRSYGRGMEIHRAYGDAGEKERWLARAEKDLRESGAPLWRWARLYRAGAWARDRPVLAQERLARLATGISAKRQPALLARVHWSMGLNETTRNRFEEALPHFERMRELLLRSEGPGSAAFADLLTAEASSRLGALDEAWNHRVAALRGLAPVAHPKHLHATLYSSVEQLFLEGHLDIVGPFVEELSANARQWGTDIALAESALQWGRLLASRGDAEEAAAAFERARAAAARISEEALRRRTESTLALYQAESLLDTGGDASQVHLDTARDAMIDLDYRYQLPRIDAVRAGVALSRGDRHGAIAAIRQSIEEEERIRREVDDLSLRAVAFEGAQRAFDLRIGLALDEDAEGSEAFRWAEASRARVLGDLLAPDTGAPGSPAPTLEMDDLAAALPHDTDLLEWAVLPDRLVAWHVTGAGRRTVMTEVGADEIATRVERFRQAIEHGGDAVTVRGAGGALHRLLLGPFESEIAPGRHLVIVPDRSLARVPFAALWNPEEERYLIERHPVTVAPSATAFLALRERASRTPAGPPSSVLAVGANHPSKEPLPQVASEAREVAELYPRSQVLTGGDATVAAFRESAARAEVIHFSGHGEDDEHALTRSHLYFAPADAEDSGVLYGGDLIGRRIDGTRLAVLAACRTATWGDRGRETISGLAAAFLAAGVPTVVASLWPIDDAATHELMLDFHSNLRQGLAPSEALRQAQIDAIQTDWHPRDWAGMTVLGSD